MSTGRPESEGAARMPQWGLIASGPLKGWRFALLQVVRIQHEGEKSCALDLRCCSPSWPFPTDVRMNPLVDEIRVIGGPKARLVDLVPLMKLALEHGYCKVAATQ